MVAKITPSYVLIGILSAFISVILIKWALTNILVFYDNNISLIAIISIILLSLFLIMGIWALYNNHQIIGIFLSVSAFMLLSWLLLWFLPIYDEGTWVPWYDWIKGIS